MTLPARNFVSPSFVYLASPYSDYPKGPDEALRVVKDITVQAAVLDLHVFSPLVFGAGLMDFRPDALRDKSHRWWCEFCDPFLVSAGMLVVLRMEGWDKSRGVNYELKRWRELNRPPALILTPDDALRSIIRYLPSLKHEGWKSDEVVIMPGTDTPRTFG